MKAELIKISWDDDRRIAQSWRRDQHGWFRAGWGFDVQRSSKAWLVKGYRVAIVDHASMIA